MTSPRSTALLATGATAVAVALVAGLLALATVASPARADQERIDDATGDVKELATTDGTLTVAPAPENRAQDIVSARAAYARGKVRLRTTVRALPAAGFGLQWDVRTADVRWKVYYDNEDGTPEVALFVDQGGQSPCAGLRGSHSRKTDTVRVVLPRSCIGAPRWIRFGAGTIHFLGDGSGGYAADDGRGRKRISTTLDLRLGSRIRYR